MWWNTPGGWGPMYGWWIMPFFGIIFLVLVLLIVSRFFGGGGFCGRSSVERDSGIEELRMAVIFFFAVFAFADDTVNEFSLKTVDGKTIAYRAASRIPMVVNIGAHW
jgi:hypothetical protein